MTDLVIGIVLAAIIGAAVAYIVKAKRSGVKCIGCSAGGCAPRKRGSNADAGCCSCGCHSDPKEP